MLDFINEQTARLLLYILEHFPAFAAGVGITLACVTAHRIIPALWSALLAQACQ